MSSIKEILDLAEKFEKMAQQMSAQRGDIQSALEHANLWNLQNDVAQLISTSRIPDNVSVSITILVDKVLNVNFTVSTNPHNPGSLKLAQLLKQKYSHAMKTAIQSAGLSVASVEEVPWLTF